METPVAIYALYDKRDGLVRYVGKTASSMSKRLDGHFKRSNNFAMQKWLADAGRGNVIPIILECAPRCGWEKYERGWISWFRERGQLLNVHAGGSGVRALDQDAKPVKKLPRTVRRNKVRRCDRSDRPLCWG